MIQLQLVPAVGAVGRLEPTPRHPKEMREENSGRDRRAHVCVCVCVYSVREPSRRSPRPPWIFPCAF